MSTPLAWKNLLYNRVRTAVGMAGVGFAALLILMQMGFKGAIEKTATQIYGALEFDLMLRSPAYLHLTEPRSFPHQRLLQAASLPEVQKVRPFHIGLTEWQAPGQRDAEYSSQDEIAGMSRGIIILGADPADPPFSRPDLRQAAARLTSRRFVAMDSKSKAEYGPVNGKRFGVDDLNVETRLGDGRVRIVGTFELGTGMACNGACMTNPEGYQEACPWRPAGHVTVGLIQLEDPTHVLQAKASLERFFGEASEANVVVLTREEVFRRERDRWMVETPFGHIFQLGVLVAVFVGVAIVYQVLSNDIANMMSEYATLKAVGYGNAYLAGVVLHQSVLLSLVGYVPALGVSWALYQFIGQRAGIPMELTGPIMASVLALSVGMCVVSGVLALQKLFKADPADLF